MTKPTTPPAEYIWEDSKISLPKKVTVEKDTVTIIREDNKEVTVQKENK